MLSSKSCLIFIFTSFLKFIVLLVFPEEMIVGNSKITTIL